MDNGHPMKPSPPAIITFIVEKIQLNINNQLENNLNINALNKPLDEEMKPWAQLDKKGFFSSIR